MTGGVPPKQWGLPSNEVVARIFSGAIVPRRSISVRTPLLQAYVVERLAYIDSVFYRSTRKIDADDLERLKVSLTPDERFPGTRYFGDSWPYVDLATGETFFHYVHTVHQPTKSTFHVLKGIQERNPGLLHLLDVHLALDLTTSSDQDAARLHEALLAVLTPKRLSSTDHVQEHETTYIGKRRSGNEIAVYSDGKRKVRPASPRVHLEWRVHGAKALRRANIKSALDLAELDHRDFWSKRLRLHIMPALPRLTRVLELRAARRGRPMSPEQRQRTVNALARISRDYYGRFSAQGLDEFLVRGLHPKPSQLYKPISNKWALPGRVNALWDEG